MFPISTVFYHFLFSFLSDLGRKFWIIPISTHWHKLVVVDFTEHPNSASYFVLFKIEMILIASGWIFVCPLPVVGVFRNAEIHPDRLWIAIMQFEEEQNIPYLTKKKPNNKNQVSKKEKFCNLPINKFVDVSQHYKVIIIHS